MSGPVGIVHAKYHGAIWSVDLIWFLALINVNLHSSIFFPCQFWMAAICFSQPSETRWTPIAGFRLRKVQAGFMVLLLGMIIYVSFFDVSRVGRDIGWINDQPRTDLQAEPRDEKLLASSYPCM